MCFLFLGVRVKILFIFSGINAISCHCQRRTDEYRRWNYRRRIPGTSSWKNVCNRRTHSSTNVIIWLIHFVCLITKSQRVTCIWLYDTTCHIRGPVTILFSICKVYLVLRWANLAPCWPGTLLVLLQNFVYWLKWYICGCIKLTSLFFKHLEILYTRCVFILPFLLYSRRGLVNRDALLSTVAQHYTRSNGQTPKSIQRTMLVGQTGAGRIGAASPTKRVIGSAGNTLTRMTLQILCLSKEDSIPGLVFLRHYLEINTLYKWCSIVRKIRMPPNWHHFKERSATTQIIVNLLGYFN